MSWISLYYLQANILRVAQLASLLQGAALVEHLVQFFGGLHGVLPLRRVVTWPQQKTLRNTEQ